MRRVRELREEKGVSQVRLAVAAGMDPATLNRLEMGKANPNLKTLERLADALGVEVVEFFPKAEAVSLEQWLEERCGHSYLAMSFEELGQFIKDAEDLDEQLERRQLLREEIDVVVAERIKFPALERRNIGNVPFEEIHTRWIRTLLVSVELRIVSPEDATREVQELALA
jgi:transcriptional regulator with XRE-family HTH domain